VNYRVEALPDDPVILMSLAKDALITEDMANSGAEIRALLDQADGPMFVIMDMRELSINLNDIILGSNLGTRGEEPLSRHPNIGEMIFVSSNAMVKLAVKGLNTVTFGNLEARVFDSVGDALIYVRSQTAG
jgi:hypothetical protein